MKKRPEELKGRTWTAKTGCGNLYVTVNNHGGEVFELFAKLGKAGGCGTAQTEAIGRLVSHAARSGLGIEGIIKHLKGIRCHEAREDISLSCADAIGGVLKEALALEGEPEETRLGESTEETGGAPVGGVEMVEANADTG